MMRKLMVCGALALTGCCFFGECDKPSATAVSPDGKNEIRLWADPLAYEVVRDGVTLVSKTDIGLKVDGKCLKGGVPCAVKREAKSGTVETPVYKKAKVDLAGNETLVDFGDWGVRLAARDDGVAYRFETKLTGTVTVECEKAPLTVPEKSARCWANRTNGVGQEESPPQAMAISELKTEENDGAKTWEGGNAMIYLPLAYTVGGKFVAVTESDVRDYPIWNFHSTEGNADGVRFDSYFAGWPKKTQRVAGWGGEMVDKGGRWVRITEEEKFLTRTAGTRTFPWRTFILADAPSKFCEADIVYALAAPKAVGSDFSWVKPGKVAWDWWNCFDNQGEKGCNTKTYERFIDFAAKTGVEYVIFDEGWSEKLNIWKFAPDVDVPHLIDYANKKGVGIILWMAWAQVYGDEAHVAEHFAKLGAKGFKVDFMDRGDAEIANFLEKFAAACAKNRMLVDYHGVCRPVGMQRMYPNIINYEGIHGLEHMKWFCQTETCRMFTDVCEFYLRLTAGPMDYTPGAMCNWAPGTGYKGGDGVLVPGSVGTRCRQMAMMSLYEAPLQMLCDSPTNYEKNMESFSFMSKVPTVWADTVGLGGCPDSFIAAARQAKDGSWYAAGMTDIKARDFTLDTSFLGAGDWTAEVFRDAPDSDKVGSHYVHETKSVKAGEKMPLHMAPGGGFIIRFAK